MMNKHCLSTEDFLHRTDSLVALTVSWWGAASQRDAPHCGEAGSTAEVLGAQLLNGKCGTSGMLTPQLVG